MAADRPFRNLAIAITVLVHEGVMLVRSTISSICHDATPCCWAWASHPGLPAPVASPEPKQCWSAWVSPKDRRSRGYSMGGSARHISRRGTGTDDRASGEELVGVLALRGVAAIVIWRHRPDAGDGARQGLVLLVRGLSAGRRSVFACVAGGRAAERHERWLALLAEGLLGIAAALVIVRLSGAVAHRLHLCRRRSGRSCRAWRSWSRRAASIAMTASG